MHIARRNVAKDQCVEILPGLGLRNPRVRATRRSKLILSGIGNPGRQGEEESLNGNDINRIDRGVSIHIGSRQPASGKRSSDIEEMPLRGDHIHGVDAVGAWQQGGLCRCHDVASARDKRIKKVIARAVGQRRNWRWCGTSQAHQHTGYRRRRLDSSNKRLCQIS